MAVDEGRGVEYDQDYFDEICDWMMDLGALEDTATESYTIPLGGSSVVYHLPGWEEDGPGTWYLGKEPLDVPLNRIQVRKLMDIFGVKKPELRSRYEEDDELASKDRAMQYTNVACSTCSTSIAWEYSWKLETPREDRKYFCCRDCVAKFFSIGNVADGRPEPTVCDVPKPARIDKE